MINNPCCQLKQFLEHNTVSQSSQYFLLESSLFCLAASGLNWELYFCLAALAASSASFLLASTLKSI